MTEGISSIADRQALAVPAVSAERLCDVLLSSVALLFFAPIMAALALVIWMSDGGAPIFAQARVGQGGRTFRCLKFRTMRVGAESALADLLAHDHVARAEWDRDQKLTNDPRVTPLGSILRRSSLDELPQLFNVLAGHMSAVGPRPIVPAEISRYGRYFHYYVSVKPGLTGLWQVSGRSNVRYRRRVAMDTLYIKKQTFRLYCGIIISTIPSVLLRRGAV